MPVFARRRQAPTANTVGSCSTWGPLFVEERNDILGIIPPITPFRAAVHIIWILGMDAVVPGAILFPLGATGRKVAGRAPQVLNPTALAAPAGRRTEATG
jgi:hypothetical protein